MKVQLQDVIEAIDFSGMETEYYYSTRTEEILMIFDGMVNGDENPELIEEIQEGFIEDFIPLPGQYDINEYRMMEEFICELPDERKQNILARAIKGKGAFRRFKDRLYDLGLEKKWFAYRDAEVERIAREWCADHGIEILKVNKG